MNKRQRPFLPWTAALATAAFMAGCALFLPAATAAERQQQEQHQEREFRRATLHVPPEQSLLSVTTQVPEQADVDKPFEYIIQVQNTSRNMALHDIRLHQQAPEGLKIESVDGPKPVSGQPARQTQPRQQQRQQEQQQDRQAQAKQGGQSQGEWTIGRLGPGEAQEIRVTASTEKPGDVPLCLAVKSYTPALCFSMHVVDKDMQLVKRAPESASICQPIELEYYVQNEGTAAIERFTIRDDLGERLVTKDGKKTLEFAVDGLPVGETRKFVATVYATEPGTVSSRATAILPDGKEMTSGETQTEIQRPELAVALDGPQTQQMGSRFSYTARVTNRSSTAVSDINLVVMHPRDTRLLRMGEPRRTEEAAGTGSGGGQQPTPAERRQGQQTQQDQTDRQQQQNWQERSIQIGSMEPNETRAVSFTVAAEKAGLLDFRAVARMACGIGEHEAKVEAVAMRQTEVIALPALAVYVADEEDPVSVQDEFIYTITVVNEGDAVDNNIALDVEVPEQLEVLNVGGTTQGQKQEKWVKFQPVEQLQPGQKATWQVRTKATGPGQANLRAKVTSEGMKQPTTTEEPTNLIGTGQQKGQQQEQQQKEQQQKEQNQQQ